MLAALLLAAAGTAAQKAAGVQYCQPSPAFPSGFDYPQSGATIGQWVWGRDTARARVHGWNLWAGLNHMLGGTPVWRTWCTSTQAFAAPSTGGRLGAAMLATASAGQSMHSQLSMRERKRLNGPTMSSTPGEDPINFPASPYYPVPAAVQARYPQCYNAKSGQLADGPTFENNGDIMVAGVIYNGAAYQWIRSARLYDGPTLTKQVPPAGQTRQMAAMPVGSIVLKPMMWPVQGTGYTALPLWDNATDDHGRYAGFEVQSLWPRAAAVTAHPQAAIATLPVSYLHKVYTDSSMKTEIGPITYAHAGVVGIDQFYHFRFPNLAAMAPCDRAILDASAYWAYGKPFGANDYLVVMAMHIMTKEQPAWTFQSTWWHDRPNEGPFAADRPDIPRAQAPGPWRHYLLASTYGIPAQPGGSRWPIAYNPYIELAADHPIRTNCMNCHHRAGWRPAPPPGAPKPTWATASYEAPGGPDALDIFAQSDPVMNGLLGVDSIWSISDRAFPSPYAAPSKAAARTRTR